MIPRSIHPRWQSLGQLLPILSSVICILAGVFVLPFPYIGNIAPMLGLFAIYYWSIYRPDLLRPLVVFALGVLNDSLHMMPLGLSAVIYLSLHQLVFSQRRFFVGQMFPVIWTGFAVVALLASSVQWIVLSIYRGQVLSLQPIVLEYFFTVLLFPLPAWILMRLQKAFLNQG